MNSRTTLLAAAIAALGTSVTVNAQLPDPGMDIVPGRTALLITDPQNDFLSPDGVAWGVVGESVTENNTVENIEALFEAAKANDIPVFISPHYYYPTDHGWQFEGALERLMHNIGMFDRQDALTAEGFERSKDGEIVANSGKMREIDASVRIGDQLVLFECRSIERPLDFELGSPKTLATRCEFLDEKIEQAITLREFILAHPTGRNYDFGWAKTVSTFVVSPFVEWVWERSDHLWHDKSVPRILQADEAISYLHRLAEAAP